MKPEDVTEKAPLTKDMDFLKAVELKSDEGKDYAKDTGQPAKIIYFCQDCGKITTPKRVGKRFRFSCSECNGSNVSFGSEQSIMNYYRINESTGKAKK